MSRSRLPPKHIPTASGPPPGPLASRPASAGGGESRARSRRGYQSQRRDGLRRGGCWSWLGVTPARSAGGSLERMGVDRGGMTSWTRAACCGSGGSIGPLLRPAARSSSPPSGTAGGAGVSLAGGGSTSSAAEPDPTSSGALPPGRAPTRLGPTAPADGARAYQGRAPGTSPGYGLTAGATRADSSARS